MAALWFIHYLTLRPQAVKWVIMPGSLQVSCWGVVSASKWVAAVVFWRRRFIHYFTLRPQAVRWVITPGSLPVPFWDVGIASKFVAAVFFGKEESFIIVIFLNTGDQVSAYTWISASFLVRCFGYLNMGCNSGGFWGGRFLRTLMQPPRSSFDSAGRLRGHADWLQGIAWICAGHGHFFSRPF
jgi:hypothetical protein